MAGRTPGSCSSSPSCRPHDYVASLSNSSLEVITSSTVGLKKSGQKDYSITAELHSFKNVKSMSEEEVGSRLLLRTLITHSRCLCTRLLATSRQVG